MYVKKDEQIITQQLYILHSIPTFLVYVVRTNKCRGRLSEVAIKNIGEASGQQFHQGSPAEHEVFVETLKTITNS